jgi:hypothetical protein
VEVRYEDVRENGPAVKLTLESPPQNAKPGTAVEDVEIVSYADFYAGGIASIAHVFRLGSRG